MEKTDATWLRGRGLSLSEAQSKTNQGQEYNDQ